MDRVKNTGSQSSKKLQECRRMPSLQELTEDQKEAVKKRQKRDCTDREKGADTQCTF